ncbi:hypothetical protein [Actinomyces timonensis]|uniref:hypothetical protein n=1 Tax=Actinomyces timonensis TaxID=1288391 RepID=UPI000319CF8E|nr:hypothetical protein [Actinomyces timonensis]
MDGSGSMATAPGTDLMIVDDKVIDATTGATVSTLVVPETGADGIETTMSALADGSLLVTMAPYYKDAAPSSPAVLATVLDSAGQPLMNVVSGSRAPFASSCATGEDAKAVVADPEHKACLIGPSPTVASLPDAGSGDAVTEDLAAQVGAFSPLAHDSSSDAIVLLETKDGKARLVARTGYKAVDTSTWNATTYKAILALPEAWSQDLGDALAGANGAPTGVSTIGFAGQPTWGADHIDLVTYSAGSMSVTRWAVGG